MSVKVSHLITSARLASLSVSTPKLVASSVTPLKMHTTAKGVGLEQTWAVLAVTPGTPIVNGDRPVVLRVAGIANGTNSAPVITIDIDGTSMDLASDASSTGTTARFTGEIVIPPLATYTLFHNAYVGAVTYHKLG